MITEGGVFSRPTEEWIVDVAASGPGRWEVAVPAIVAIETGERADALDELYRSLHVRIGEATFAREGAVLVLRGEGDVHLIGGRAGRPSGFGGWATEDLNVTRRDADGPLTTVSWSVDFSGGRGHTCWADAEWSVEVAPGETEPLVAPGELNLPGRPWNTACA